MTQKMEATFPKDLTSSLDFKSCDYKWFIERSLNLRQKRSFERNLDFGAAFADAVFLARKAYYIERKSEKEAMQLGLDEAELAFGKVFFEAMQKAEKKELIKTPDRLVSLLETYWKRFPLSKEEAAPFLFEGGLSAEQAIKLRVEYPDLDFSYNFAVKPDMLVISNLGTMPIDEKTVTKSASDRIPLYAAMNRPQFLLYAGIIKAKIEDGTLCIPPLHSFEVRRACLNPSAASTKDDAYPLRWKLQLKNIENFMLQAKRKFLELKALVDRLNVQETFEDQLEVLSFHRNRLSCMEFNRPCPLLEHCAAGRELSFLGFKQSSINPLTKEVTFHE